MKTLAFIASLVIFAVSPTLASHHHAYGHRSHHSRGCSGAVAWDCRSPEVRHDFLVETGHPHGWRGHIVDHVTPLACGGADAVSNMQWQTRSDAAAKDKVERIGCANGHRE